MRGYVSTGVKEGKRFNAEGTEVGAQRAQRKKSRKKNPRRRNPRKRDFSLRGLRSE
jgi:hypothetical protein